MILQLKAIGIKSILAFPFPTSPEINHIKTAIISLVKLKALEIKGEDDEKFVENVENNIRINKDETTLTDLGKVLVYIPLHPRYAKMLLQARKGDCLGYMLLIVCALSVDQVCRSENGAAIEVLSNEKKIVDEEDEEEVEILINFIVFRKKKKKKIKKY